MTLWLTRPAGQVENLLPLLSGKGAKVLHLPLLEIEALPYDQTIKSRVLDLDRYDLAVFISSNAARLGMRCVESFWPQFPAHIKVYALGPGTAAVLEDSGLRAEYPRHAMSSETLLAMPELARDIETGPAKRALIFRGAGGRERLAGGLRERGVEVDYLELYRRKVPQYSEDYLRGCAEDFSPDAVVITSGEALENLRTLFEPWFPGIRKASLFVSSQRLRELALEAGFGTVVEMPGADDQSIINALEQH